MWTLPAERQYWVIQPLVDAGLGLDEIRGLLFRLGFESIVGDGHGADVRGVVDDQPLPVQLAWSDVIGRMLAVQEAAETSPT